MYPVCDHHSDKLCDTCKQKVGMQSFFVLRFTSCDAEAVFKVVDGFFNIYAYFISGIPIFCTTDRSGICTKILLRINVDHSSTGRCCTWVITMAYTFWFLCDVVPFPFHLRADKFHGRNSTAQMGFASFTLHQKWRVMWTTGDAVFVDSIINAFDFQFVFQRNIGLWSLGILSDYDQFTLDWTLLRK